MCCLDPRAESADPQDGRADDGHLPSARTPGRCLTEPEEILQRTGESVDCGVAQSSCR